MEMIATKATFQKYPAYKDSGVEWLGEIPEHWEIGKLGTLLKPVSIKNQPHLPLLSVTREAGVIERNIEDDSENHNFIPDDLSGYKVLNAGQFGMNKMKAWQGSYGIAPMTGIVSPAYYVFDFNNSINSRFFHLAIRSRNYVAFFGQASDGVRVGQWDLNKSRMKEIPFFIPPIQEQTVIANFLDDKTAKIDRAITQKEKMITLLKERKQIIIQNTVTKGLNPNAKMKESGVEWIGEIPERWEVKALKYIAHLESGSTISSESFVEDGYPVFGGNGFRGYAVTYTNEGKHALIGRQGALCGNVNYADGKFFASEHAIVVYHKKNVNVLWLGETIKVADFNRLSQSAAQPGIAVNVIKKEIFPFPSFEEQNRIASHIETQSTKIDKTIALQERQIEKLKELKSTLIDSAVTGKIKVY
jgi:type I restriction enzyme S subunit